MTIGTFQLSVNIIGYGASKSVVREADHPNPYRVRLDPAQPLSNWVKTDADTAAGDLAGGHGLTSGTFDVYWDGGARYDVDVTISTNAVSLDGGSGDDFPSSANTTVVISKQKVINTMIDGDAIKLAFVHLGYDDDGAAGRGRLLFEDADGDDIADLDEADGIVANKAYVVDVEGGDSNPFSGDPITSCKATHSNTDLSADLQIVTLEDSTP